MNVRLIKATNADKAYLLNLRKLTMTEHLERVGRFSSDEQHLLRIEDCYGFANVIYYKNEKVGTIKYLIHEKSIEIMQVQIHPKYQGKGLGKIVIKKIIKKADTKQVKLSVLKGNPAIKLYEKLGFKVTREESNEWYMTT